MIIDAAFRGIRVYVNLSTGALATVEQLTTPVFTASGISDAGGGWYRVSVAVTTSAAGTLSCRVNPNNADNVLTYAAGSTSTDEIFVWGAQLEQRSEITAYQVTTTQPITNYIPVLQSAADNVARFDHDPTTGESLGFLVEESRSNLVLQSEDFGTTWTNTNSTEQTNVIVSPAGTLTGDKLIEDTTASVFHRIVSGLVSSSSGTFTASVYIKAAERSFAFVGVTDNATGAMERRINLSTGVIDSTNVSAVGSWTSISASSTNVGNGWWRVSLTGTQGGGTNLSVLVSTGDASGNRTYTGNGYSGIYIFGAQLEAGAFPTSYIPTVASQVTRAADAASMTGANFSSWYRADEGTFYTEFQTATPTTARIFQVGDGTGNNRMDLTMSVGNIVSMFVQYNGSTQASQAPTGTLSANVFGKVGLTYKNNDFNISLNNSALATDTSGNVPLVTQIGIGRRLDATLYLNGHLRKLSYYPKALPANLQALNA